MKLTIIATLLCLSGAAFATNTPKPDTQTQTQTQTQTSTNTNTNNIAGGSAQGGQGGKGGEGGKGYGGTGVGVGIGKGGSARSNATGGASTATGGNSNASSGASSSNDGVTVNNTTNEAQQYRIAPSMMLGSPASGPCTGASGGAALSTGLFGFSANHAAVSRGCDLRELARVAAAAGRQDIANKALEAAAEDLGLNEKAKPEAATSERVTP